MTPPIAIFISSAVLGPISTLYFLLICAIIVSSNLLLAIFIVELSTDPLFATTAISVVPPPISTIKFPDGFVISIPDPNAAATGSSIKYTFPAPACIAASITALFSISFTCDGTHIMILGCENDVLYFFI